MPKPTGNPHDQSVSEATEGRLTDRPYAAAVAER